MLTFLCFGTKIVLSMPRSQDLRALLLMTAYKIPNTIVVCIRRISNEFQSASPSNVLRFSGHALPRVTLITLTPKLGKVLK